MSHSAQPEAQATISAGASGWAVNDLGHGSDNFFRMLRVICSTTASPPRRP